MKPIKEIINSDPKLRPNIAYKRVEKLLSRWNYKEKSRRRDKLLRRYLEHVPEARSVKLTREEIRQAREVWSPLGRSFNPKWFSLYKYFMGAFSPYYVPEDIWKHLEVALNNPILRDALQHKVLCYKILPPGVLPDPVGTVVNGSALDAHFDHCTFEVLLAELRKHPRVIMKRALGEGGGKGVTLIEWEKMPPDEVALFENSLPKLKQDYIFQKILEVHPDLAQFNPSSANSFRLMTLNVNGRSSLVSSYFRMAKDNRLNDNGSDGGVFVSVHPDGSLHHYGVTNAFTEKLIASPTGIRFEGHKIEQYLTIVEKCKEWHASLPYMGFISWDVTMDINGAVRVIEINLESQETTEHQAFNGPLFGERTEEVIQYVIDNPPKRHYSY